MQIKIPQTLTARIEETDNDERPWVEDVTYTVVVEFGNVEVARLKPSTHIWYGTEDDTKDIIAAETVAPYLARIFSA